METPDAARHRVSTTKNRKRKMNQKTTKKAKNRQNWTQKQRKDIECEKAKNGLRRLGSIEGKDLTENE